MWQICTVSGSVEEVLGESSDLIALKFNEGTDQELCLKVRCLVTNATSYDVLIGQEALFPPSFTIDNWFEHAYYRVDWETDGHHLGYIPLDLHGNHSPMAHHCMLKEAHTISYFQQANHEWIKGDEEDIAYAQATKSLRVVPIDIQHGPEVLQRFKVAHKPLVKTLSSFESIESHGEPIKPLLRITLLELFGGIGTGLEALLQSGMVVQRYFYVDIDPIARQVVASRMKEFITRFPQQFVTTAWKANPNLQVSHILDDQSSCQPFIRQEKPPWFLANTIGKPRGAWPTFVSFPGAHAFQGDGPGLVYRHASATWDEPSPEERERVMGGEFQDLLDHVFIDHRRTSRDHPQADGLAERMVQTCKKGLQKICLTKNKEDWDLALPYITMGYRMVIVERASLFKRVMPMAMENLSIAQHRDTLRYAHTRGGSYKPKRQPNDTLDTFSGHTILRIKVIRPLGVLELQGADRRTIRDHSKNCAPCHLPNLDPTIITSTWIPPLDYPCQVCQRTDDADQMLFCDNCNGGYHLFCLKPELTQVLAGN
ncbi:hypothetical protein CY35_15G039600 [Sphagnum magellanicum]|nr:hypothetical protein CY35_15G039600 [Sphagnum magellanicum]